MLGRRVGVQKVLLGLLCVSMLSQTSATAQRRSGPLQWRRAPQVCPPTQMPYCPPASTAPYEVSPTPNAPAEDDTIPAPVTDPDAPKDPNAAPVPPAEGDAQPNTPPNVINNQPNVTQQQMNNALANVGDTGSRGSRAPNMIGDTTAGGCGGLLIGGIVAATVAHPTYACSRLNIAENNSAALANRAYMTYRHFENASDVDIFSYSPQGRTHSFAIDQWTLGVERKISPNCSIEFRLPIQSQLGSNINFVQGDSGTSTVGNNNLDEIIANGGDTTIGNLSTIFKVALFETCDLTLSSGIGINIPTAPNINISGQINDPNFQVYDVNSPYALLNGPLPTGDNVVVNFSGAYKNQTVNLQPFLAAQYAPVCSSNFYQGFLQLDVPLNKSSGNVFIDVDAPNNDPPIVESGKIAQQILLRLNSGVGHWWIRNNRRGRIKSLATVFELHYTTTLNDPDAVSIDVPNIGTGLAVDDISVAIGGLGGRVDVLNATFGIPIQMKHWDIYNGFTVPLRDGADRGFDFEYALALERRF